MASDRFTRWACDLWIARRVVARAFPPAFIIGRRKRRFYMTAVVVLLLGILPCAGIVRAGAFAAIQGAAQHARQSKNAGITPTPGARLPLNLAFHNSAGKLVRLGDYFHKGRPVILNFVYFRCPGVCNYVLNGMVHAFNHMNVRIGTDYDVLTVSFDPTDTPAAARAKKASYVAMCHDKAGARAHWHFLTGNESAITALTAAVGFHYVFYPALHRYNHAAAIYVCTPGGRISKYLFGIKYNPNTLKLCLIQAGDNRISNVFDQILLLCCQFDPNTGQYTPVVLRVMTLLGVAVVLGLSAMFAALFYWEYKHRGKSKTGGTS